MNQTPSIHDTIQTALAIIERYHGKRVVKIEVTWQKIGPTIKVFAEPTPPELKSEDELVMKD